MLLAAWTLVGWLAAGPTLAADCDRAADPKATSMMAGIERGVRETPIVMRMHIESRFVGRLADVLREIEPKALWGVIDGDTRVTRFLFVFSSPGRMAGTTLLIHDVADPSGSDQMWLYLNALGNFQKLGFGAERTTVPATTLSYADARGYFAVANHRFHFATTPTGRDSVAIIGCPRTPELVDALGYGSIELELDPSQRLVRTVTYRSLAGEPMKSYHVVATVKLESRWFPKVVVLEHAARNLHNRIEYEYWNPEVAIPAGLFRAQLEPLSFRDRIQQYLESVGLGERIGAELERAERRVREQVRRLDAQPTP